MAFCVHCGRQLVEGAKFCAGCGKEVIANKPETSSQRKTVYDGEVHKCPNCGDIIDAYETICQSCGYEIRGRKTTSVVHELSLKLETVDDIQKKDELIRTFYIPNTKEDIHEFFILALSNIKMGGMNTKAWMVKLEQAYQKAELSFSETQEFEHLKLLYEKAQTMNQKHSMLAFLKTFARCFKSGYAWALLFVAIGGCMWAISGDFESTTSIVGTLGVAGGAWIALITFGYNSDKNEKQSKQS